VDWIHAEGVAYWVAFCVVFFAVAIWESGYARRKPSVPEHRRWAIHAILFTLGIALTAMMVRLGAVAMALAVEKSPYGLFNRPELPAAVRWIGAILALDLVRYGEHWCFHRVAWLWRLHEVHHSDADYDVSTAVRFHPLETLLIQSGYLAAIAVLAPPAGAVLAAELIATAVNLWSHANASLAPWVERLARAVVITPDLHRIHHSEEIAEQGRNFGQTLSIWDRMFGTYLKEPAAGVDGLVTGLRGQDGVYGLRELLAGPFRLRIRPSGVGPAAPGPRHRSV
jgi:sterol desaturase/sphingolipid hydroxylase (fatty acid hydroxylase superfamily)